MMRNKASFRIGDAYVCKQQMLSWANRFSICCFMDNHNYKDAYSVYDCIVGAGAEKMFSAPARGLPSLQSFVNTNKDWLFGHFTFDVNNETENLISRHPDRLSFPDLFFFVPTHVLYLQGVVLTIESLQEEPQKVYAELMNYTTPAPPVITEIRTIQSRIQKEDYLHTIDKLKEHIHRGDCYEINFCQEFFSDDVVLDALSVYQKLSSISPSPFAAYYKLTDKYALCASPERYLQKQGCRLISQPIKGTAKRNTADVDLDNALKKELQQSPKNKIENVMITDLVRNDLSRICKRGSVHVAELFGVYTYPQVHQMITTVEGEVSGDIPLINIITATFPMGSMTGAPKQKVLQLIDEYESSKRGLYSGSIGYITPDNNFDFNVVIRTILYNETNNYLSFQTGGAITFGSNAEEEYSECLLKASAMINVLTKG